MLLGSVAEFLRIVVKVGWSILSGILVYPLGTLAIIAAIGSPWIQRGWLEHLVELQDPTSTRTRFSELAENLVVIVAFTILFAMPLPTLVKIALLVLYVVVRRVGAVGRGNTDYSALLIDIMQDLVILGTAIFGVCRLVGAAPDMFATAESFWLKYDTGEIYGTIEAIFFGIPSAVLGIAMIASALALPVITIRRMHRLRQLNFQTGEITFVELVDNLFSAALIIGFYKLAAPWNLAIGLMYAYWWKPYYARYRFRYLSAFRAATAAALQQASPEPLRPTAQRIFMLILGDMLFIGPLVMGMSLTLDPAQINGYAANLMTWWQMVSG